MSLIQLSLSSLLLVSLLTRPYPSHGLLRLTMCSSRVVLTTAQQERVSDLKLQIFAKSAACDRGFAATPSERRTVLRLVDQLKELSPERFPTRNFAPHNYYPSQPTPLAGTWRLVFTTAYDVLQLSSLPLTIVQGIYQQIQPDGDVANVIDFAPRFQTLFPQQLTGNGTTIRAKVSILGRARGERRVGLTFNAVELKPLVLFSSSAAAALAPKLRINLPGRENAAIPRSIPTRIDDSLRSSTFTLPEAVNSTVTRMSTSFSNLYSSVPRLEPLLRNLTALVAGAYGANKNAAYSSPGFFDVLYLDDDTLIIQQNEPGGIFVSVRVPSL